MYVQLLFHFFTSIDVHTSLPDKKISKLRFFSQSHTACHEHTAQRLRKRVLQREMHVRRSGTAAIRRSTWERDERQSREHEHFLLVRQPEEHQGEHCGARVFHVSVESGLRLRQIFFSFFFFSFF